MGCRLYMIPEASGPKRWSQMANVSPERADARPSGGASAWGPPGRRSGRGRAGQADGAGRTERRAELSAAVTVGVKSLNTDYCFLVFHAGLGGED